VGPTLPDRLAWCLMNLPALVVFGWVYRQGRHAGDLVPLVFAGLWVGHFAYRALVYPWRRRGPKRRMPLSVVVPTFVVMGVCAYLNARWLTELGPARGFRWLLSFRFAYGLMLYVTGLGVNRWADAVLRKLRARGTGGYEIPHGGLYTDVSCPAYFGEIVQWLGWAIATWSLPGLAMAVMFAAMLVPRAVSHHHWYRREFAEYPRRRHALIPYVV
jgi:steroid 5-alpha reductase family enzyme